MTDAPPPWSHMPPAGFSRPCPYCAEPVQANAVRCWRCGSQLVPVPAPAGTARRFAAAIGLAAGGALVGVSPILPWFQVALLGNASLFDTARLADGRGLPLVLLPVALVVCGAAAIVAAFVLRDSVAARTTGFILFGVSGVLGGLLLISLLSGLAGADGFVHIGAGPWVSVVGALCMLVGAIVVRPVARQPHASGRALFSSIACAVAVASTALGLTAAANLDTASHATASSTTITPEQTPADPPSSEPALPEPSTSTEQPAPPAAATTNSEPPVVSHTALADAEAVVQAKGYRPDPGTSWESTGGLQVILGTIAESADGYANRAFFFNDGKYLGTDTSADSAGIQEVWSTGDTVALSYALYNAEDPMCCPTANAATVRYHWTGRRLVPLDAIPPADPAASPSRR